MELDITELRLGLPGGGGGGYSVDRTEKKRVFSDTFDEDTDDQKIQTSKSQVVGWPPVCAYRKKNSFNDRDHQQQQQQPKTSKIYVKVSMDGAPFLRKIDLGMHKDYFHLAMALEKLFDCFGMCDALKDADSSEYVPIYEDKDGDWMLAGDVPWEMFIESCKRLRIMRRADAEGFGLEGRGAINKISN